VRRVQPGRRPAGHGRQGRTSGDLPKGSSGESTVWHRSLLILFQSKAVHPRRGEYNVYSTFQSHEPEFDYLKSLEIEEKINKIRWLKRKNPAHFLLSTNDKTIKLWKVSERDKRAEGYNLKEDSGVLREPNTINTLRVSLNANVCVWHA